jgi:predicted enzyme related to lactoylglutathione lyase
LSEPFTVHQNVIYFYSYEPGTIEKVSTAGGAVTEVVFTNELRALAVDATSVYWAWNPFDGDNSPTLRKTLLDGGSTQDLADGSSRWLALDASNVYFFDGYESAIRKVAKVGGAVTSLATNIPFLHSFLLAGSTLYWTDQGGISMVGTQGGDSTALFASEVAYDLAHVALGEMLYWISDSTIRRGSQWGGTAQDWKTNEPNASSLIAVENGLFWFTKKIGSSTLRWKNGDLVANLTDPRGLTASDGYLYWVDNGGVWKLAVPSP